MENLWDTTAGFYDTWNREVGDEEFYLDEAVKADGNVLEIACGTGRIYLPMLEEGVDAYGIDLSEAMLEELRSKAEERGLTPKVEKADMRNFELDQEFSLIIIPYRSFLHNTSLDDSLSTLRSCYEHLEEGGKLVLNFFVPDFRMIVEDYETWEENEIKRDGEKYINRSKTKLLDPVEMVAEIRREILHEGEKVAEGETRIRIVTKNEMELMLRLTGFSTWEAYGGFEGEELSKDSNEMVWEIEK